MNHEKLAMLLALIVGFALGYMWGHDKGIEYGKEQVKFCAADKIVGIANEEWCPS
jgi:hypothetical protein